MVIAVAVTDGWTNRRRTSGNGGVGILAGRSNPRRCVGKRLRGVEQSVSVGVTTNEGGVEVIRWVGSCCVVIPDRNPGQRQAADVRHDISERHGAADRYELAGRGIVIGGVRKLDDVDRRNSAEVMVSVAVAHRWANRRDTRGSRDVCVLTGSGNPRGCECPRLGRIQPPVRIDVATNKDRTEIVPRIGGCAVVVSDENSNQGQTTRVRYDVSESDGAPRRHKRTWSRVVIGAVRQLDDVDGGSLIQKMTPYRQSSA